MGQFWIGIGLYRLPTQFHLGESDPSLDSHSNWPWIGPKLSDPATSIRINCRQWQCCSCPVALPASSSPEAPNGFIGPYSSQIRSKDTWTWYPLSNDLSQQIWRYWVLSYRVPWGSARPCCHHLNANSTPKGSDRTGIPCGIHMCYFFNFLCFLKNWSWLIPDQFFLPLNLPIRPIWFGSDYWQ